MAQDLSGKRVAFLIAEKGTEDIELVEPMRAVLEAGAETVLIGPEGGKAMTRNNDLEPGSEHEVDIRYAEANPDEFDAVVVPGGTVGADKLRANPDVVRFVRSFFEAGKPVAAICHGPWVLVEAGVLEGRTLTSYPSLQTDIRNAGGEWVDQEVVVDKGLVTSRSPADLQAFTAKVVEEIAEGVHAGQSA
ncbi:MAG TPA: type 1 glutamine amidotransferase domain-containing protein [Trueperaceae bacterium]|nr:type 1 glutamine amidotransferase domain-containing protein [Trueperaceae bacterium]